jgi:hypothetical protein
MFLAHRPSTAASMLVKGRQRFGKGVDHQHHLDTAEAVEIRHQGVATTNTEPLHPSNASQTPSRTREMLPDFQAGAKAAEDVRVTREKQEEIKGEAAGKMEATRASVRNTTMHFRNKK